MFNDLQKANLLKRVAALVLDIILLVVLTTGVGMVLSAVLDYDKTNKVTVLVSSSTLNGKKVYKTYGKGIMQSTYRHIDGSAVTLTVAQTYWPISNVTIHRVGVIGKESGKILAVEKENALDTALAI